MVKLLAALLPAVRIPNESGPYLDRYTLAVFPDGAHLYLHHFLSSDAGADLHNHPWSGRSIILSGGYREERRVGDTIVERVCRVGDTSTLQPDTFHRLDILDVEAGCWTLFYAGPHVQSWGFWDRVTGVVTPWRVALRARGLL